MAAASRSVSGSARNDRSPSRSVCTPPKPTMTSEPKRASCATPTTSSTPVGTIGCSATLWLCFVERAGDGQVRLAYGRLVRESELDASQLPLVYKSGTSRLHDNRDPAPGPPFLHFQCWSRAGSLEVVRRSRP